MAENSSEEAILLRCQATVIRAFTTDRCDGPELAELVADLSRLPADQPERARIAGAMVMVLFRETPPADSVAHVGELLHFAEADPPSSPRWALIRAHARILSMAYAGLNGQPADVAAFERETAALTESLGRDHPSAQPMLDAMRSMAEFVRAVEEGNESVLQRMPAELTKLAEQAGEHPELAALLGPANLMAESMAAIQRGEHADAMRYVEQLNESVAGRPEGDMMKAVMVDNVPRMKALTHLFTGLDEAGADLLPLDDAEVAQLEEATRRPGATADDQVLNHLALGGAYVGGGERDHALLDKGIEHFREALRLTPPGFPRYVFCLQSVALGLLRRSEVLGTTDGLDEATALLEKARPLLSGPQDKQWVQINEMLAAIRHRFGDLRESGELGLEAQLGYIVRAMLESDVTGAKIAVRDAAQAAVDLARRCIQSDNLAGTLSALDTGRGLMLFAATELRRIPARLATAGRADLARRWAEEGPASNDLRREVLSVLTSSPEAMSLLNPPSLQEIQSALHRLDADALVYLVPADLPQPGLAVIAPADGNPAWMALPNLTVNEDDDVERYLTTLVDRSRDLAAPTGDGGEFTDRLSALCDWAWRAAIGPLLERYFADRPRPDGRVPRVVLIPMGDLARIPWQAARRGDGAYAVELAAFTQAASARLMCENAARTPVALSSAGLVVGDPDTGGAARTLDAARLEAHAIRREFYQGARYVGRRPNGSESPSGRGTATDVRRWLTSSAPTAGVLLHLACHGAFVTGSDDAKSCLLLAAEPGGSGADELTAEEIPALLATVPDRHVGLVVLAACNTGRSVHGYDEAYSLGTAFLAGGACSVLSTQWSVPDAPTSSLMYLLHHYCRREGLPPWQALRQAQMWMLDPRREAPERMPAELLRSVPDGEPAPLAAWAGFIHLGQ